ncbi:type II toxin-antitoxin system HicA family toxin [Chitinophaga sp. XS-30]|uniref:type II toxin-antitoxin system HicA family toxin n=1 Tax=Chitinophaga sp. XS-30 TaxID=2604421 RepID=UPI0011DDF984|nr:type II toxin-antitoxin system HicA family toxin [Chitinophaga sp. XS-30]
MAECSELKRTLFKAGWIMLRQGKGSHIILVHPGRPGIEIVFPDHGSDDIGKGLACKILKLAGLSNNSFD